MSLQSLMEHVGAVRPGEKVTVGLDDVGNRPGPYEPASAEQLRALAEWLDLQAGDLVVDSRLDGFIVSPQQVRALADRMDAAPRVKDEPIKRMSVHDFRILGYLQEVNRRVLHPAGLALEVHIDGAGTERLGGVWDYRDDAEGIVFEPGTLSSAKAALVDEEIARHSVARVDLFGAVIQPRSQFEGLSGEG